MRHNADVGRFVRMHVAASAAERRALNVALLACVGPLLRGGSADVDEDTRRVDALATAIWYLERAGVRLTERAKELYAATLDVDAFDASVYVDVAAVAGGVAARIESLDAALTSVDVHTRLVLLEHRRTLRDDVLPLLGAAPDREVQGAVRALCRPPPPRAHPDSFLVAERGNDT
jgi:hypothetical protein